MCQSHRPAAVLATAVLALGSAAVAQAPAPVPGLAPAAAHGVGMAPIPPGELRQTIVPAPPDAEQAPIALLIDLSSGRTLFARGTERRFAPASITKVMTAYVAFDMIAKGELKLGQPMPVRPDVFGQWRRKGSTMFLQNNEAPTVDQLLHGIVTVSANDGAAVLADGAGPGTQAWLYRMNAAARRLGMHNSHFGTPNGWPDEGRTFTTAQDLARMGEALLQEHPALYRHFFGHTQFSYGGITQVSHDPITGVVAGADGMKTGYTDMAGYGFLGTAERGGRRLLMVIGNADSGRQRRDAARALMEWGFAAFDNRPLFQADEEIASAKVNRGSRLSVPLVARGALGVTYPKGTRPPVTMEVRYQGPIAAPVRAGSKVADLMVTVGTDAPYAVPLYAKQDVEVAGPMRRLVNGLLGWFV